METMASAPPYEDEEYEELQNRVYDLNLALITSELEYLNGQLKRLQNEIAQMDITKCDEQCKQANNSIESNAIDAFLEKEINNIFNK
jgi:septation ring formation regulator EzrA